MDIKEEILVKEVNKQIREQIKMRDLAKKREERIKQKNEAVIEQAPLSDDMLPPNYHEFDEYPKEKIQHKQVQLKELSHSYQEKDLARIVVNAGDQKIVSESILSILDVDYLEYTQ